MPLLGAHQSIAGGLHLAFARNREVGGESLQIFTANQRQWRVKNPDPEAIKLFRATWSEHGDLPVAAHASYLINLAASAPEAAEKSAAAFVDELHRCRLLGIRFVVIHPGSHGGAGVEAGLVQVVRQLDMALERAGVLDADCRILLETTAGQGTSLGSSFAELGWLLGQSRHPEHLGVCVDTCHLFAAGYDLRSEEGYGRTFAELEREIGCGHVHFFHLNDSKKGCGSRVDRHEHIGRGEIGLAGFRRLLADPRFRHLPMTLETPKGEDLAEDVENLRVLRSLMAGAG